MDRKGAGVDGRGVDLKGNLMGGMWMGRAWMDRWLNRMGRVQRSGMIGIGGGEKNVHRERSIMEGCKWKEGFNGRVWMRGSKWEGFWWYGVDVE